MIFFKNTPINPVFISVSQSFLRILIPKMGGGTITVNQEAEVTAVNSAGAGTVSVGVVGQNKCNITVDGGSLSTMTSNAYRTINVGGGNLTVTEQGRVQTASNTNYDVPALVEAGTWDIQSGIVGYNIGSPTAVAGQSEWNAIVGGEVTLPVLPGNTGQDLSVPPIGSYGSNYGGYWNSVTVNPNGNLTLGTVNPDNPD